MAISFSDAEQENELITRSTALPEDAGEGSLRPRYLNEYIGQERAKENLRIFIQAAKMRGEALDHVLLHGPPGLGKTTLAAVIANEMGVNMRITSGPTIEKPGDLAALLTNLQENDILFVDRDPPHEPRGRGDPISRDGGLRHRHHHRQGASANSIRLDLPKFTLIGATTRSGQLSAPLR